MASLLSLRQLRTCSSESVRRLLCGICRCQGMKDVVNSLSEDINGLAMQEEDIRKSLEKLDDDLKVDGKQKKKSTRTIRRG